VSSCSHLRKLQRVTVPVSPSLCDGVPQTVMCGGGLQTVWGVGVSKTVIWEWCKTVVDLLGVEGVQTIVCHYSYQL
jgi:hypothetical protein